MTTCRPSTLAGALRWQNRLDEALAKLHAADLKQPDSLSVIAGLATTNLLRGDAAGVGHSVQQLRSLHFDVYAAHYQGLQHFAAGRYEDSLASFREEASTGEPTRSRRGNYLQAAVLCELNRLDEARVLLEAQLGKGDAGTEPGLRGNELLTLAYVAWKQNQPARTRSLCLEAASSKAGPELIGRAGVLLARSGNVDTARRLRSRLDSFADTRLRAVQQTRLDAEILLAARRTSEAVDAFRKLDRLEPALRPREGLAPRIVPRRTGFRERALLPVCARRFRALATVEHDYPGFLTDANGDGARAGAAAGMDDLARRSQSIYSQRRGPQAAERLLPSQLKGEPNETTYRSRSTFRHSCRSTHGVRKRVTTTSSHDPRSDQGESSARHHAASDGRSRPSKPAEVFFKPYDSSTYSATIFGRNKVDKSIFQSAQAAFGNNLSRNALRAAMTALRTQAQIMGTQIQGTTVYDPADPCPYGDGSGSANVKKLTK